MADKFKNILHKAGFGPLQKRPKRGSSRRKNIRTAAENEWIARERLKDRPNYDKMEDVLERQRRVKFAKEHPLMPRTKKKRPIKKMGGPSRKPATKFDVDVRSPFANQAFLRKVSGR